MVAVLFIFVDGVGSQLLKLYAQTIGCMHHMTDACVFPLPPRFIPLLLPQQGVLGKKESAALAVRDDAIGKEEMNDVDCADKSAITFTNGATSISAALDEIDQNHLLPAMSRLERYRDKTVKCSSSTSLARDHGGLAHISPPHGSEMELEVARTVITAKAPGDVLHQQHHSGGGGAEGGEFYEHGISQPAAGLHGPSSFLPSEPPRRATKPASSADEDHTSMIFCDPGSTVSSHSTWMPPITLQHNTHGLAINTNNQPEGVDEAVHNPYLEHARKLGRLLVRRGAMKQDACLFVLDEHVTVLAYSCDARGTYIVCLFQFRGQHVACITPSRIRVRFGCLSEWCVPPKQSAGLNSFVVSISSSFLSQT